MKLVENEVSTYITITIKISCDQRLFFLLTFSPKLILKVILSILKYHFNVLGHRVERMLIPTEA